MNIKLGEKIRQLRHRDGRKQEDLADALGVSTQAVSRWEVNGGYPDMELIPVIANYFHVSIDELFGYSGDRERKINDIVDKADKILSNVAYPVIEGALSKEFYDGADMLRAAADEFPNEPRILARLGKALYWAGYNEYGAPMLITDEECAEYDTEYNSKNLRWQEALRVYEKLLRSNPSPKERDGAAMMMVQMYRFMGEYEKARAIANAQSRLGSCREVLLEDLAEGEEKGRYRGEEIVMLMFRLSSVISSSVSLKGSLVKSEYSRKALLALTSLYDVIFSDGRCGFFHWAILVLYFQLAILESQLGDTSKALEYFDKGFEHVKSYRSFLANPDYTYTAPLVAKIKPELKPLPIREDFWQWEMSFMSEALREELRKNEKYRECFGEE